MKSVYIIGSLRNPEIPKIGNALRDIGLDVFDDWHGGGPEADDKWQEYEGIRGRSYKEALRGYAAQQVFNFDKLHLDRVDGVVMVMPAGRSGHLEFGYARGLGKPGYILFDKVPERYDVMYNFATDVFFSVDELIQHLNPIPENKSFFWVGGKGEWVADDDPIWATSSGGAGGAGS
jgi:hypothetical protein